MGNLIMMFDTETTDRTDFKAAYDAPHQPNLIQLGYKVYEPFSREVMFEIGHLVDTTGFSEWNGIAPEAQKVHGINEELVRLYGWSPSRTMDTLLEWSERCSLFVAHNKQFDINVVQCFAKRAGYSPASIFSTGSTYCTMATTTNICKIPGKYGFKWPTLDEAYRFFVDPKGFSGAHNALVDVNACGDIFWKLVDREFIHFNAEGGQFIV